MVPNLKGGKSKPGDAFQRARARLRIASIDTPGLRVEAQYNPKELQIDKSVSWVEHRPLNRTDRAGPAPTPAPTPPGVSGDRSDLEFHHPPTRSMSIELLFDGYEKGRSVEREVEKLELLSSMKRPGSKKECERRPHHCIVVWGQVGNGVPPFLCVIETLTTKYTMWSSTGTPLRATCTVKLKEAIKMEHSGPGRR
jgi:hypothetical protein